MLFRRFEHLIDVFKASPDVEPPAGMLAFYAYYLRQVWPLMLAVLVVGFVAALIEVALFSFLGQLIDMTQNTPSGEFFEQHQVFVERRAHAAELARPVGRDPAARIVVGLCGCLPRLDQRLHIVEQRHVTRGEVGGLGKPVVHLDIDVEVVVAIPRRRIFLCPDSLKVCREPAGPAGADEEVAPNLEKECRESWIQLGLPGGDAIRERKVGTAGAEVELDAAHQGCVVSRMPCLKRCIAQLCRTGQDGIKVIHRLLLKIGSRGEEEEGLVTCSDGAKLGCKTHPAAALSIWKLAIEACIAICQDGDFGILFALERRGCGGAGNPDNHDAVDKADKVFARKCLAVLRKCDGNTAIFHIECAAITGRGRSHISVTIDDKVSENLVAAIGNLSAIRLPAALPTAGKCLIDEALGLRVFAGKEQPADFWEGFMRIRTVILKRRA